MRVRAFTTLDRVAGRIGATLCTLWKLTLSPLLGSNCRFVPTCSEYASEAFRGHGAVRGLWLSGKRICRCNSLCAGGYDPVPERTPQEVRGSDGSNVSRNMSCVLPRSV